jgi:diguanylate cyclase (GGDEF)-like protein/PAS domain S-box-containing protein
VNQPAQRHPAAPPGLARRVHDALMPDYNRRAAAYWWALALAGAAALAHALITLASAERDSWLRIGIGCAAVAVAALFPIRVAKTTITFAAGEAFIFLQLLLFGPAAATLAAVCEAAVGSYRSSRRWTSRIASPAIAAIAMSVIGAAFDRALASAGPEPFELILVAVSLFAAAYGLLASLLVTLVPLLKRDGPLAWRALRESAATFGGIAAMHSGSALLGGLLYLAGRQYGEGFMLQGVAIVTLMLTTAHFYLQHQAAESTARRALLEASEAAAQEARRHAEELADSQALFRGSFVDAGIAMALLASDGTIRQANAAACALLGLPLDRVLDTQLADHVEDSLESAGLRAQLRAPQPLSAQTLNAEYFVRCAEGRRLRVLSRCSPLQRTPGVEPCLILQLQDITAQHHAEAELRRMAYEDVLTALPNRRWLLEYLDVLAGEEPDSERGRHALLLIDLDRFKLVNDTLGHTYGDQYLRLLTDRIRAHLRPSDQLARLGGDEFGVVLLALTDASAAAQTARRLAQAIAEPLRLGGEWLHPTASIGVALGGAVPAPDLLRQADAALHRVKGEGGNGVSVFDSHHHRTATLRLRR